MENFNIKEFPNPTNDPNLKEKEEQLLDLNNLFIQNIIGSGSFCKVYKAKNRNTSEIYAVKVSTISLKYCSDDVLSNISREIRVLSKLDHPSVLKFIGYSSLDFKMNTKPTIIMEYAQRGSLDILINNPNITLSDTQKLIIVYGIASAMSYLHSHDIIHRDLKPGNIYLNDLLLPKVANFGPLKGSYYENYMDQSTLGSIKGTPIYMAPEIWAKSNYSQASDVYAFSMIVYEIITNEKPFKNCNIYCILSKIKKNQRPQFNNQINKSYKNLIEKCWSNIPEYRPSFLQIVDILKNDKGFITDSVNEVEYHDYIDFIEGNKTSFNSSISNSMINQMFSNAQFQQKSIYKKFDFSQKILPFDEFKKLDQKCQLIIKEAENDTEKQFNVAQFFIESKNDFPSNTEYGIRYLKHLIKKGCKKSAFYFCELMIKGKIIPKNLKKARKYLEKYLKDQPDHYLLLYGKIYKKEKNYSEAKILFEKSISYENKDAYYECAKLIYSNDREKSLNYYLKAIERNCSKAMYKYGLILLKEEGKKKEGIKYIKMAAEKEYPKAQLYFASLLEKGEEEIQMNIDEANSYLKKAARNGNIKSMHKYALNLLKTSSRIGDSLKYLKKASDKGNIDSIYQYGLTLLNPKEAARFIRIAAINNHSDSMNKYAELLLNGKGVRFDSKEAISFYKRGIAIGNSDSMNGYADMLFYGNGIEINKEEAFKYYKMAIDKGNVIAMNNYAYMLEHGEGVEVNKEEALKYYKIAADKGNVIAMNNYAYMLEHGEGVEVNKEEASKYYKMAEDKANHNIMNNYSNMLENDEGFKDGKEKALNNSQIDFESILAKYEETFEKMNFSLDYWLLDLKNYQKQKLIQRNENFEIYEAFSKETNEIFIIKIFNSFLDNFFQLETSEFFRDFYVMTKLFHPAILRLIGFCPLDFDNNQKPVYVTEYTKESLYDIFQRKKDKQTNNMSLNPTKKLIIIYGIASAMNYLHKKNIIHRNLISKNILLDESLHPKLCNFGQSKDSLKREEKLEDISSFSKLVYEIMTNNGSTTEIPESYLELINRCSSEEQPTFKEIVKQLKEESGFIVEGVNDDEFKQYVMMDQKLLFQNEVNRLNQLVKLKLKNFVTKKYLNIKEYKTENKIGEGVFSIIYKIQEKETGKYFAGKVFNESAIDHPEKLESQFKEIKLLTKLNHPSIIKYIGYSPVNLQSKLGLTIVIETGELLRDVFPKKGWNSTKKLINIYGIASGMKYLHSMGIIHRNLKSGVIIEDENFYPKICSFSFFKYLYELNDEQTEKYFFNALGSSPEVLNDSKYSKSSDVYSFAIIMYEIMTGQNPFPNVRSNFAIFQMVGLKNQRPQFDKPIPKCYQDLIESCWATDPNQRPSFDSIVDKLKSDESFLTDDVDRDEYRKYIESIDQATDSFDYLDINDYEKIGKIGFGSFANIFKVMEKSTKKFYAAKVVKKENDELTEEENNILSLELRIMKRINHISIIKIKGFSPITFNYNPHPTIILELGKCSLQYILDLEKKGLSPVQWDLTKKLINIYGIASGMEYLHSINIIHRDLKPSNILEDDFLFPKISDFGLSKEIHKNEKSMKSQSDLDQKGTPCYMAPEIWNECNYTMAGDVYSFSMIAYEIMSGETPFNNYTNDLISRINKGERPKFNESIPKCYQNLIEKCWAQDLTKRPTFSEIVKLLKTDEFLNDFIDKDEFLKYVDFVEKFNDVNIGTISFEKVDIDSEPQEQTDQITFSSDIPKYDLKNLIRKEKLGSGSYAKVYKVVNYSTGEIYAAKILMNELILCPKEEQINFIREVNILSKLNHRSIMKFIGYSLTNFKQEERPVLVTEILSKGTLEDVLEMERIGYPFSEWNETKKIINIYGIASAMKYLHSKSYIHRDLKPQNILLDNNMYPKLSDFGFSKLSPSENTNASIGTPMFMAPEIWSSFEYTKAVDVYAFSLIVFQIITNVRPFNKMNAFMISFKINNNYRPEINENVPDCYKELIQQCWHQDPEKRPSFDEIVDLLKNNPEFKNEKVDIEEFNKYVNFIEKEFSSDKELENKSDESLSKRKDDFIIDLFYRVIEQETDDISNNEFIIKLDDYEPKENIRKDYLGRIFKVVHKTTCKLYTARSTDVDLSQFEKENILKIIQELNQIYKLNHPSIIKFIGFSPYNFKKESKPVFISELSPKLTLGNIFKNEKKKMIIPGWNSTKKLINIYGIASAMKYLHSKNIVHQNLKPENIFIDEYLYPKLFSEFGSFTHKLNIQSMTLQSVSKIPQSELIYSAPEVLDKGVCTKESDVYSFCMIIYEMITNENLNYSPSVSFLEEIKKRMKVEIKSTILCCYRKLIEKGLSANPNERPTFEQIVEYLENEPNFITPEVSKNEFIHYITKLKSEAK